MKLSITDQAILNNGIKIPYLGLGAYLMTGKEAINAIHWALEAGYRHIDTAKMYNNEKEVGAVVKSAGIPRSEIFVTTKLWNDEHGFDRAKKACYKSLERLGFDYIDLYLIHWPGGGQREETWRALENLYEEGVCKSIGVSNYTVDHLKGTLVHSNIIPQINQVEFSPFLYQNGLLQFCNENKIQFEAYSPLGKGEILNNLGLKEIAKKYNKSTAQVLIRWCLQHKIVVIPKSVNRNRIFENANVFDFEISMEDMNKLDSFNRNLRVTWNPEGVR